MFPQQEVPWVGMSLGVRDNATYVMPFPTGLGLSQRRENTQMTSINIAAEMTRFGVVENGSPFCMKLKVLLQFSTKC